MSYHDTWMKYCRNIIDHNIYLDNIIHEEKPKELTILSPMDRDRVLTL